MTTFANGESGLSVRTKINNVLQHADGTAGELVINDAGADVDFRVESDTNANALFVDGASGNVGIGVVPSAWNAAFKAIEFGSGNINSISIDELNLSQNAYYGASTWQYKASSGATQYRQSGSVHRWFTAPSGTAGNQITFTQTMTLDASGNLLIGTTSSGGSKLRISGLPTSSAGLSAGDVWNDGGTLKIA